MCRRGRYRTQSTECPVYVRNRWNGSASVCRRERRLKRQRPSGGHEKIVRWKEKKNKTIDRMDGKGFFGPSEPVRALADGSSTRVRVFLAVCVFRRPPRPRARRPVTRGDRLTTRVLVREFAAVRRRFVSCVAHRASNAHKHPAVHSVHPRATRSYMGDLRAIVIVRSYVRLFVRIYNDHCTSPIAPRVLRSLTMTTPGRAPHARVVKLSTTLPKCVVWESLSGCV